jgi:hypothetical protein
VTGLGREGQIEDLGIELYELHITVFTIRQHSFTHASFPLPPGMYPLTRTTHDRNTNDCPGLETCIHIFATSSRLQNPPLLSSGSGITAQRKNTAAKLGMHGYQLTAEIGQKSWGRGRLL